ncbi:MAG: phosphate signaling complex protein PhoU [Chloroflexi bacterium]|nr:phosphate signaling complex protein PhoU [Chloroflexota bacterium]
MTKTRAMLDRELTDINELILRIGSLVDAAIEHSMQALAQRDVDLARKVSADDAGVNALRFEIEEACLALIARQQPAASDLRAALAAFSIVTDLERMGDHAAGIARTVLHMGDEPLLKPLIDLPRMAEICREMLRLALQAYIQRDVEKAVLIIAMDDSVDALYTQIFREILSFMVEDPRTTSRGLYLMFAAHNLERIGDRVTNIVERILFMTSGELRELNPKVSKAVADLLE